MTGEPIIYENERYLSPHEKIDLICEELGVNVNELLAERARAQREAQREREAARLKAEQERLEAEQKRAVEALQRGLAAGVHVAFLDGAHTETLACPHGGAMVLPPVAQRVQRLRQRFVADGQRRFPGAGSVEYTGAVAGELTASVPCTCEAGAHEVRIFVSSAPVVL